jgi:DNA-binding response OmpR family regulator
MSKPIAFIVEDDPQIGKIFSISLQADFETEIVIDGDTALARLAQIVPTIIILDLNLPTISGRDILQFIRADARLKNVSVIISTADERQAETLQEYADIVLLKPVSPGQLRQIASRFKQ